MHQKRLLEEKRFEKISEGLHLEAVEEMSHEKVYGLFQAEGTTNPKTWKQHIGKFEEQHKSQHGWSRARKGET